MRRMVAVSGGFDPLHVGHIRYIHAARTLGDELVVIVNSDEFLMRKKGFVFMPMVERVEIVGAIVGVDRVIDCIDDDQTVCRTLERLRPSIFANGGDRTETNIPEREVCARLGIELVFGVGGGKIQSSRQLVKSWYKEKVRAEKAEEEVGRLTNILKAARETVLTVKKANAEDIGLMEKAKSAIAERNTLRAELESARRAMRESERDFENFLFSVRDNSTDQYMQTQAGGILALRAALPSAPKGK